MEPTIPDLTSWTYYERALYSTVMFVSRHPRSIVLSCGLCLASPCLAFGMKFISFGASCFSTFLLAVPGLAWGSLLLAWFPKTRGPYSVGSRDVQIQMKNCAAAASCTTISARLYYPSSDPVKHADKWLPAPEMPYCKALGGIYGLPEMISVLLLYPMRFICTRSAKDSAIKDGAWPVAVFSHGLCGTRTMYSALCTELASHGYFVVAPEHADGSACFTVAGYCAIPYTSSSQADRTKQLKQRVVELESCWQALPELGVNFANSLDLSRCILIGHSFGGAAVACAASADSFRTRSSLVLLDPWLGPAMNLLKSVQMSTLIVMQGSSMLWSENAADIVKLLNAVDAKTQPAFFTEVIGARHQDASDVPFFLHVPMAFLCASSMTKTGHWVWKRNSELIQQFLNFANEDADVKAHRLSSVSGVRVHDWKSWLRCQKQNNIDLQMERNPAAGA